MFTADMLVAHAVGDYVLQSDWMALEKTKRWLPAVAHAAAYTLPFLCITQSWKALLFIAATHCVIDRFRLARYVCWAKNFLAPRWITLPKQYVCPECRCYVNELDAGIYCDAIFCGRIMTLVDINVRNHPWNECSATGYHRDRPMWLAGWLLFITDNVLHAACNAFAINVWG